MQFILSQEIALGLDLAIIPLYSEHNKYQDNALPVFKAVQTDYTPSPERPLRIGTRGSALALAQAHAVRLALMQAYGLDEACFTIETIRTSGDHILGQNSSAQAGKALFTKEIEDKLLSGEIDLAVHSTKDIPTQLPAHLELCTFLPRQDARDAFISRKAGSLKNLPAGASIGTVSQRRQALITRQRPDLKPVHFRGNVDTRLEKLASGTVDAILLAAAGLIRLGLSHEITELLSKDTFLPAVGQGAIAIEVHEDARAVKKILARIHHQPTALCVSAERAFLNALGGSCQTPIAGHAYFDGQDLIFRGLVLSPDSYQSFSVEHKQALSDLHSAQVFGEHAGLALLKQGGEALQQLLSQYSTDNETG